MSRIGRVLVVSPAVGLAALFAGLAVELRGVEAGAVAEVACVACALAAAALWRA